MPQTRIERNAVQRARYWANPALSRLDEKMKYQRRLKRLADAAAAGVCFNAVSVQHALTMWGRT